MSTMISVGLLMPVSSYGQGGRTDGFFSNNGDYNNRDGEEHFEEVLQDYIDKGVVTIIDYRDKCNCHFRAYNEIYRQYGGEYDWVAFFDFDEQLVIPVGKATGTLADLLAACRPDTRLCLAADITCPTEFIRTKTIADWQKEARKGFTIGKRPCVFILLGSGVRRPGGALSVPHGERPSHEGSQCA